MNTAAPKSFGLYKAVINFLLLTSILSFILLPVTLFLPANMHKIASTFSSRTIQLTTSRNNGGETTVTLSKINSGKLNWNVSGNKYNIINGSLSLPSSNGETYKAYYSSEFNKLKIYISGTQFAQKMKLFFGLISFFVIVAFIIFFYTVRRILNSLKKGTPFSMQNARDLDKIAIVLFWIPVLNHFVNYCLEYFIGLTFNLSFVSGVMLTSLDMLCLLAGVFVATLSYVLKQGVRMKEEQDLTI